MDKALDRRSGQEYTASDFLQLHVSVRRDIKPHLKCPYCEAAAHFRSASKPSLGRRGKVAHFYALPHGDECDITRDYSDPWECEDGDRTVSRWEQRDVRLIVRIEDAVVDTPREGVEAVGGEREESRSRPGGDRTRTSHSVSRGPQRLLEQLVHWPSFKMSSMTLRMPDAERSEMPVHDAFVRFETANLEQHTARWHGFWGILRPWSYWANGSTYFSNFGPYNRSFRVSLHRERIAPILARYGLSHIDELVGHYMLLFDHARESTTGRFMADINSVNHIGFVRADAAAS